MKKIEFKPENIDFNSDEAEVKTKLKDFIESDESSYLDFGVYSEASGNKMNIYDITSKIVGNVIFLLTLALSYTFFNHKFGETTLNSGEKLTGISLFVLSFGVALMLALAIYVIIYVFDDFVLSEKFYRKCLLNDKKEMLADIENLKLTDFIKEWFNNVSYTAYSEPNTIKATVHSFMRQEKLKEMLSSPLPIVKIKSSKEDRSFKVYYATEDGTVKNEQFSYNAIFQNINVTEPHIRFNNEGIFVILPLEYGDKESL